MATAQSPLARQPDKLDYASPTQFRFGINQLPKVEFFTVGEIFLASLGARAHSLHLLKTFLFWVINWNMKIYQ